VTPDLLGAAPALEGGRAAHTVALHRDPLGFLRHGRETLGDVYAVDIATTGPCVVVTTPDAPQVLGEGDPGHATAGDARRAVQPQSSARSVFGADGRTHDTARARLAPAFRPEAIAAHAPVIAQIAEAHIARWPQGRPLRLLPRMRALADEVVVRCLLGVRDASRVDELVHAIGALLWTPGNPPTGVPAPHHGPPGKAVELIFRRRSERVARGLRAELRARRAAPRPGATDLLTLLLDAEPNASEDDLVDELLVVLMAGQEPAAAALTWTALCLAHLPELAVRIARDPGGPLLDQVVEEALRLHPPAMAMLRTLTEPAVVGDRALPAGTTTLVPIALLHRDPHAVSEPDRFRPGRTDAPRLWAFGAGGRQCIAQPLARAELATILPVLLRHRTLRPAWPRMERMALRGTIQVPHRSGLVFAPPRRG
jgi:cytochrome P450